MKTEREKQKEIIYKLSLCSVLLGFISGIFGLFTAIPAIVCGHISIWKIKRNPYEIDASYKRMAIGGLLSGYCFSFSWAYVLYLLYKVDFLGIQSLL